MENSSIFQNPKSGSFKLTGTFDLVDELGKVIETVTDPKLCGCGLSQEKPFCDKSHAHYVKSIVRILEDARISARAIDPFGVLPIRAKEIRQRALENRLASGETLIGIKYGGALIKGDGKNYGGIFGFLTDAMEIKESLELASLIAPKAEAEVVFKLGKELSGAIDFSEVSDYVSHVASGIEVLDCRYGAIDPFIDDAIADNACSGAFIVGNWVVATPGVFTDGEITISINGVENQRVPVSAIAGNPWQAVVNASQKLSEVGAKLPAGSIIFSGSATKGIPLEIGEYSVEISNLGSVSFKVN